MKCSIRVSGVRLLIALFCFLQLSWAQVTDKNTYAPPNYSSFIPPAAGGAYTDPIFGTTIKRITNAVETSNLDRGGNLVYITNEYSSMTPFNLDNSKFLLLQQSYFGLYSSEGRFLAALPMEISASSEPRWSRSDPNALYYHVGNQLKKYDVSTAVRGVVHTFSEYSSISGRGESDISFDGDHMVLVGDDRFVFVYEISTDSKRTMLDSAGRGFDSVYITPDNNVTITWLQAGTSRYNGIELFDSNMTFLRQVAHAGGHMDVTRDNGEEVLIWTNANDSAPLPNCNNGIVKIRLRDASQTCLLSLDWSLAVHVSGSDNTGYVFIETYAPANPQPGSSAWAPYTNEIMQIRLDGTEVRRLGHHRSRPFGSYIYMPRASVSRDGKKLVFSSNYNLQTLRGYALDYTDVYQIDVTGSQTPVSPSTTSSLVIGTDSLSAATQSLAYEATLGAQGGTLPYSWKIAGGSLPAGLSLDPNSGRISGIPAAAGSSSFTVEVADGSAARVSKALSLSVAAPALAPQAPVPTATSTTRVEQDAAAVAYTGSWFANNHVSNSAGSGVLAMDAGSRATFTFTGTSVRWIGYRDEWSGIANVYLDGELKTSVDTYGSPSQFQRTLYAVSGLAANTHSLVIEVTGTHSSGSAGSWVWIDSFDVDNTTSSGNSPTIQPTSLASGRFEQDSGSVSYAGNWFDRNQAAASGGTVKLAMDRGSAVTFSFNGTGVSWIGYRDAWSGMAAVWVDGTKVERVDTYSATDSAQTNIYRITGLSAGNHTLKVEAMERKSASSGGSWIWIDAFDVQP